MKELCNLKCEAEDINDEGKMGRMFTKDWDKKKHPDAWPLPKYTGGGDEIYSPGPSFLLSAFGNAFLSRARFTPVLLPGDIHIRDLIVEIEKEKPQTMLDLDQAHGHLAPCQNECLPVIALSHRRILDQEAFGPAYDEASKHLLSINPGMKSIMCNIDSKDPLLTHDCKIFVDAAALCSHADMSNEETKRTLSNLKPSYDIEDFEVTIFGGWD